MGTTKTTDYTQEQLRLAELAKALGHPARIAIVQYMMAHPGCISGHLTEVLPLAQSTISRHVEELKRAGIIQGTIQGPSMCYCIAPEALKPLQELLQAWH